MKYFERAAVVVNPAAAKTITWTLRALRGLQGPLAFYVDKARSGGEWTNIAGPIADACLYIDPVKWNWNTDRNTFYRVRFLLGATWRYSTPVQALGEWTRADYLKAKEVCRLEYLNMRKAGEQGRLLKRKEWGEACTCRDFDTGEVVSGRCPLCLGTGIKGGYYAPIALPILGEPTGRARIVGDKGLAQDEPRIARIVAYPLVATGDIWIGEGTGERWEIQQLRTVAEIRRIPVVQQMAMRLLPQSDVLHTAEGEAKALEVPADQPAGTEHGWATPETAGCITDFDY